MARHVGIFGARAALIGVSVALASAVCGPVGMPAAAAQPPVPAAAPATPDPIVLNFRAYLAAIDKGDYVAAVEPALTAWRLSAARDGDGGKTGVLAVNAAVALTGAKRFAEAVEPATAAKRIADANASADVPRPFVNLVIARAELAQDRPKAAAAIAAAIGAGAADTDPVIAYEAAMRAFDAEIRKQRGGDALLVATALQKTLDGARLPMALARPLSTLRLGAAHYLRREYTVADNHFDDAYRALLPLAAETVGAEPTAGQIAFAQALAWRRASASRRVSEEDRPEKAQTSGQPPPLPGQPPLCPVLVDGDAGIEFPESAASDGVYGAVVLRLQVAADGRVTGHRIVAQVPYATFGDVVNKAAGTWRLKRGKDAPSGCRLQSDSVLFSVSFRLS